MTLKSKKRAAFFSQITSQNILLIACYLINETIYIYFRRRFQHKNENKIVLREMSARFLKKKKKLYKSKSPKLNRNRLKGFLGKLQSILSHDSYFLIQFLWIPTFRNLGQIDNKIQYCGKLLSNKWHQWFSIARQRDFKSFNNSEQFLKVYKTKS